jgi:hypothetical protein
MSTLRPQAPSLLLLQLFVTTLPLSACGEPPRSQNTLSPVSTLPASVPAPGADFLEFAHGSKNFLIGAGDIASCDETGDEETAALLDRVVVASPTTTIFTAGDNVYPRGTAEEFQNCYAPTWGRHKLRTFPSIGNHDALSDRGRPYHDYFGARAGTWGQSWAAMPLGNWRIVSLNSNCIDVDCAADGDQAKWLTAQLEAHEGPASAPMKACTVVLWHHPRFSSGAHGSTESMADLWKIVVAHRVELVFNGHDHHYERFAPLDGEGTPNPAGTAEIIVGTGGKEAYPVGPLKAGSQFQASGFPGLVGLDLRADTYSGRFVGADGRTRDRFEGACR